MKELHWSSKTRKVEVSNEFMRDMKKIGGYVDISFNRSKMTEVIKKNQAKQVDLVKRKGNSELNKKQ